MAAENQFRAVLERRDSVVLKALISVAASRAARKVNADDTTD